VAEEARVPLAKAEDFEEISGRGVRARVDGQRVLVSRTGYTGEDGFEIILWTENSPPDLPMRFWDTLLKLVEIRDGLPCGLGARDTLRLEAGMCLYGSDLTDRINPFEANLSWLMNLGKIGFARAKVMNNEKNVDLESLYRYEAENKVKALKGLMQRYIGEILLNIDGLHMNEAESWIKKAIKEDEKNGTRFNLAKDHALYAELFKRKGDKSNAKENLGKAIEIFKECGADGWVVKYEKELASLS